MHCSLKQSHGDSSGGFFSSLWRRKKTAGSDFDFGAVGGGAPCHDRTRRRTEQSYGGEVDRLPMVLQLQQMVPTAATTMTPHQHQRRFGQGEK